MLNDKYERQKDQNEHLQSFSKVICFDLTTDCRTERQIIAKFNIPINQKII